MAFDVTDILRNMALPPGFNAKALDRAADLIDRLRAELAAERDKRERYREALERIADECERHAIKGIGNIARGVLDKEPSDDHAR